MKLCCGGCAAREIPFGFAQGRLFARWRKHARSGCRRVEKDDELTKFQQHGGDVIMLGGVSNESVHRENHLLQRF